MLWLWLDLVGWLDSHFVLGSSIVTGWYSVNPGKSWSHVATKCKLQTPSQNVHTCIYRTVWLCAIILAFDSVSVNTMSMHSLQISTQGAYILDFFDVRDATSFQAQISQEDPKCTTLLPLPPGLEDIAHKATHCVTAFDSASRREQYWSDDHRT